MKEVRYKRLLIQNIDRLYIQRKDLDNPGAAALLHDLGIKKLSRDDQHSLFKKDHRKP